MKRSLFYSRMWSSSILLILLLIAVFQNSQAKFTMSYLYGNYDYISLVERTNGTLNEVSPSYFDIDSNGNLVKNPIDSQLVNAMHQKGITVVPFLSNHWDRATGRAALKNKENLTTQIVEIVKQYQLDGVNVDLENLTEIDRADYTAFVKLLREKLPMDKSLSVAVAANPNGLMTGWQGSYDEKELGKVADYLMIMAYDEHYEGGEAGPVASIGFVEKSIQYVLKNVDCHKVVLGVPFYGRYWNQTTGEGGYGVRMTRILDILEKYPSTITYDETMGEVKAIVTIPSGQNYPVINGNTLSAGIYVFWFENEQSLTEKLKLVQKYHLKGSGSWSLGQESPDTWNYYKRVVEGEDENNFFYDVSDNYWAYEAIYQAKENGWIQGRRQGYFEPEGTLSRAEFATLICRIRGYSYAEQGDFYWDIPTHWARNEINAVSMVHLMSGYQNGLFRPNKAITREEVAKVLALLVPETSEGVDVEFIDVPVDRWSYQAIKKLSQAGILYGYGNDEFRPENPITRAEMVTILERIF